MLIGVLYIAVCFLAYSNGANDNFKGVATLYGSGAVRYRTAIRWGTACTLLGSVCSLFFAEALLQSFSGKGLVPIELVGSETFLLAVAVGAGATVLMATVIGFPISTTHAIVGALVGSGLIAAGDSVNADVLFKTFLVPLLISPLIAVGLGALLYLIGHIIRRVTGIRKEWQVVDGGSPRSIPMPERTGLFTAEASIQSLELADDVAVTCQQQYLGTLLGISRQRVVDVTHGISSGVVSFARGLNDTPKIAALLLVVEALNIYWGLAAVAITMACGGLFNARKVAETMGHKITDMNHGQAVSANLVTGLLVIVASRFGVPVSTTHVSVGSLIGIGVVSRKAHYRSVATIIIAWVVTLPCAGMLAAMTYVGARWVFA